MSEEAPRKKISDALPDRQLARAFGFTASDLNANRAGYLSRAQIWGAPPWLQRWLGWLGYFVPVRVSRRPRVRVTCGRAYLTHERREFHSFFRVDFVEYYALQLGEQGMRFPLQAHQHRALTHGIYYQVYYDEDNLHIHAIERAFNQCADA